MRSYATVPPSVWQTDVKKLRGDTDAIAAYFHLLTSPHSTMIGIYPLPIAYLAHDMGSPLEGASKGLRRVCEVGLATYDEDREIVWVHEMSCSQVGPRMSPKDNKVSTVAKLLEMLPICPITLSFYGKFRDLYHLKEQHCLEGFEIAFTSPFEAPSEPLRRGFTQEQEKEQEKDLGQDQDQIGSGGEELGSAHASEELPEEPFPRMPMEQGKRFLAEIGCPPAFMQEALKRLLYGCLYQCDIDAWKIEASEREGRRDEAAA